MGKWDSKVALALSQGVVSGEARGEVCCVCPQCGKPKLYVSPGGTYFCFVCAASPEPVKGCLPVLPVHLWKGRQGMRAMPAQTLREPTGQQRQLPQQEAALWLLFEKYLKNRGILDAVRRYAGLYPSRVHDRPAIIIPHQLYWPGGEGGWIARCLDQEEPKYLRPWGGWDPKVPNLYLHDGGAMPLYWESSVVYVVEGPMDVLRWLSYLQRSRDKYAHASWGTRVVALNGLHLNKASVVLLKQAELLIWVLDNDKAGRDASENLKKVFSQSEIWKHLARWPKDPGAWKREHYAAFFRDTYDVLTKRGLHDVSIGGEGQERVHLGEDLGKWHAPLLPGGGSPRRK